MGVLAAGLGERRRSEEPEAQPETGSRAALAGNGVRQRGPPGPLSDRSALKAGPEVHHQGFW